MLDWEVILHLNFTIKSSFFNENRAHSATLPHKMEVSKFLSRRSFSYDCLIWMWYQPARRMLVSNMTGCSECDTDLPDACQVRIWLLVWMRNQIARCMSVSNMTGWSECDTNLPDTSVSNMIIALNVIPTCQTRVRNCLGFDQLDVWY